MENNFDFFNKAVDFAIKAHDGMVRKGHGSPYAIHLFECVSIAETMTNNIDVLCACLLHDTVEDTCVTLDEIKTKFNDNIAYLVDVESELDVPNLTKEQSWKIRRQNAIEKISSANRDAKMVALSDKLSNIRAISRDYSLRGEDFWNIFHNNNKCDHKWYYKGLVGALAELKDTFAYQEFSSLVDKVFGK